ncbi:MAG: hypothetical protein AB7F59_01215 [Bdellovibrionales bacterium]
MKLFLSLSLLFSSLTASALEVDFNFLSRVAIYNNNSREDLTRPTSALLAKNAAEDIKKIFDLYLAERGTTVFGFAAGGPFGDSRIIVHFNDPEVIKTLEALADNKGDIDLTQKTTGIPMLDQLNKDILAQKIHIYFSSFITLWFDPKFNPIFVAEKYSAWSGIKEARVSGRMGGSGRGHDLILISREPRSYRFTYRWQVGPSQDSPVFAHSVIFENQAGQMVKTLSSGDSIPAGHNIYR